MAAVLYQSVRKHGRTTRHTVGVVMDIAADIRVTFGTESADFENQLEISGVSGGFSESGDSGSLVVDAVTRRAVALLFAGGGSATFANPIGPVLSRFGVEIVSGHERIKVDRPNRTRRRTSQKKGADYEPQ